MRVAAGADHMDRIIRYDAVRHLLAALLGVSNHPLVDLLHELDGNVRKGSIRWLSSPP
jgi:hypothetical protein